MTNEEETILVARYIIENNEEEYLYYEDTATNDINVVESILKKLIGPLPNWDLDTLKTMHDEIHTVYLIYSL